MSKISNAKKAVYLLFILLMMPLAASEARAQWIWSGGEAGKPAGTREEKYHRALTEAFERYEKRQYKRAYKTFKSISKKKRDNPYQETAIFMAGQSLYMNEDYDGALKYFEKIARDDPASTYMKEVLESEYEIARRFQEMKGGLFFGDKRRRAIKLYDSIIQRAPYGQWQADAQLGMADTYFDLAAYFDAQHAYEAFIELYRDNPGLRYAELKRSVCLLKQARGPNYDPVPFIETKETVSFLLAREKDEDKRAHYQKLYDESIEALAKKDHSIAEYYLKTGNPDAALFYFKSVADNYPETEWSARSQKRINDITRTQTEAEKSGKKKMFFFSSKKKKKGE